MEKVFTILWVMCEFYVETSVDNSEQLDGMKSCTQLYTGESQDMQRRNETNRKE